MVKQFLSVVGVVVLLLLIVSSIKLLNAEKEAAAVVVGIVCGILAGIPTSILVLVVLSRRDRAQFEEAERHRRETQNPPVIVIRGGQPQALPPAPQYWLSADNQPTARHFHVVGSEGRNLEDY